ncbi:MAG: class I SAM-dependent methyltransferase [Chloroflexi bacterium]|nr:class I SAM-dependent methyltransferase [Chloroflexota bacterium]
MTTINFGRTASDYATHRAGFPDSFFERLAARGTLRAGLRVVDLGTGTGTVARGFARRGCQVTALDRAEPLMRQAMRLDAEAGVRATYRVAVAERTALPAAWADIVSAGQCWHWFDRPLAMAEAARALKLGGVLVIAHFDWLPLKGNIVEATEQLIEKHNPAWHMGGGMGMYPRWLRELGEGGYRALESYTYDTDAIYTPESWRGRIRASAGVGASLSPNGVAAFDAELASVLGERFPGERLAIPHRVFTLIAHPPAVHAA